MGGGRGDRGDRGDRNDRGGDRGFASGGGGGDDDWSKSRRPPQREEGRGGGNSFGGGGGGGGEEAESDWRREPASGGSRGFSGGGGGGFSSNGGGSFSGGGSGGFSGAGLRREVPFAAERPKLKLDARSSSQPESTTSTADASAATEMTKSSESVASSVTPSSDPQADKWNNVMGKFKSSTLRSTLPPRAPDGQSDFGRFSSARPSGGDGFGSGGSRFGDRKPSDFGGGGSSFGNRDSGSRYGGGDARGGSGFGDRGGSSYGDRGSSGGYRGNDVVDPRFNFSPSSSSHHDSAAALPSFGPTPEEIKAAEDLKKAKANKAAERAEVERKLNEAKTAAKEAAALALEAARGAAEIAAGAATEAYMTGLKGDALVSHIDAMAVKPSGAALIAVILSNLQDPVNIKWCRIAEYGAAIKNLVVGDSKLQLSALHAVQIHLHALKFPKVMDKQKMTSVIAMTFMSLYNFEIVDSAGFSLWADDDDDSSGKIDAIVQTTNFFQHLQEEENGDDEEEDDDDEIDAPRPTIK